MSIENIDHFVVLMLENRSFDHMFGLRHGVDGILDKDGRSKFSNPDPTGGVIAAAGGAPFAIPTKHGFGPLHNVPDVNLQLFGTTSPQPGEHPAMEGFVASYRDALTRDTRGHFTAADVAVVMQSFDRGAMPAITMLADNFVLCDAWFCEVPGPTHPNRLYMHAGTSEGFAHNVFNRPFDILTIYELLERNHRSWAVYDFDLNEVRHFTRIASRRGNFRSYSPNFAQDVQAGNLPSYSFILPRFSSTHHAEATAQHAPHDVRPGDRLIADVYNHLRANDAIWSHCALIVTYDEHGGFFDHVAPPIAVNPDGVNSPRPDDNFGQQPPPSFTFDRLGPRVPALIVSPWVGRGGVVHTQLQHTSVLRAVRDRFGISQPLSHREEAAPPLAPIFDQAAMRHDAPPHLPHATALPLPPPDHHANPGNHWPDPTLQEMLAGAIRATRASHPQDDTAPPAIPRSEADVSVLAHRRWTQHNRWLAT